MYTHKSIYMEMFVPTCTCTYLCMYMYSRDVVITFANVIITTQLLCDISFNDYNCNY